MTSRASTGAQDIGQAAAQRQGGEAVQPPGVGRDLADESETTPACCPVLMNEPPRMPKISMIAEPIGTDLAGRLGQGGDQHAPADRAGDRRQHQHQHAQRVAPAAG